MQESTQVAYLQARSEDSDEFLLFLLDWCATGGQQHACEAHFRPSSGASLSPSACAVTAVTRQGATLTRGRRGDLAIQNVRHARREGLAWVWAIGALRVGLGTVPYFTTSTVAVK